MPDSFFCRICQLALKFIHKCKVHAIAKTIFKKKKIVKDYLISRLTIKLIKESVVLAKEQTCRSKEHNR